jgi:single-strand DNA-binding protein
MIIGRLGKDPEVRRLQSGDAVCNLSIATSDKYKDKTSGEYKEVTEWHSVTAYGKLAEIMERYLKKGSEVYIEGSLHTQKWTDQSGNDKYKTYIKAEQMVMIGGSKTQNAGEHPTPMEQALQKENKAKPNDIQDDDIPF